MPWLRACLFGFHCLPLPRLWAVFGFAFAWVVGLFYLVGLPFGICLFLYWADAPFPIFIGEVLSVFPFLCGPWPLVFFLVGCKALPFW